MSQRTDAYLYYGFDFHDAESGENDMYYEDENEVLGGENDWRHVLAVRNGILAPIVTYEQDGDAHQTFWAVSEEHAKAFGCMIGSHCSGDYPVYFVCIAESHLSANRGCPTEVPDGHTVPVDAWNDELKVFCEVMNIKWREPKWLLASYWG